MNPTFSSSFSSFPSWRDPPHPMSRMMIQKHDSWIAIARGPGFDAKGFSLFKWEIARSSTDEMNLADMIAMTDGLLKLTNPHVVACSAGPQ